MIRKLILYIYMYILYIYYILKYNIYNNLDKEIEYDDKYNDI